MKINGREIADRIYSDLQKRVGELQKKGITPALSVILVGNDQSSQTYVEQKQKWGEKISVKIAVDTFKASTTTQELLKRLHELNQNTDIHGIIIQRPLPQQIDGNVLTDKTAPEKDVDGFNSDSPFDPPVALAVWEILKDIYRRSLLQGVSFAKGMTFSDWIHSQRIAILGKGETAGRPIQKLLIKHRLSPIVIDSKTPNPKDITSDADIVITAVGKPHVIQSDMLKRESVLVGVGLHGEDSGLRGDYDEQTIKNSVAFYTPSPGGVGPVNVAMLLSNLVQAAEDQSDKNARVISATF